MPLLSKRVYVKKEPFRDALIYIIVCEGEKREPEYFRFFDGLTSQLKVLIVASQKGKSAPNHLIENAEEFENKLITDDGDYELWFVLDIDRLNNHLHVINSALKSQWHIALSNPCFEVWLYYHFSHIKPSMSESSKCSTWKSLVNNVITGGFNSNHHPTYLFDAVSNSRSNYSEQGYIPNIGCSQLHILGEKILNLTANILNKYRFSI